MKLANGCRKTWLSSLLVCLIASSFCRIAEGQQGAAAEYERRGKLLLEQRNFPAAIQEFRSAVKSDSNSASAHVGLGTALRENGDLVGALIEFQAAVQLNPASPDAHYNLALALGQEGNLESAKSEL